MQLVLFAVCDHWGAYAVSSVVRQCGEQECSLMAGTSKSPSLCSKRCVLGVPLAPSHVVGTLTFSSASCLHRAALDLSRTCTQLYMHVWLLDPRNILELFKALLDMSFLSSLMFPGWPVFSHLWSTVLGVMSWVFFFPVMSLKLPLDAFSKHL